MPFQVGSTVVVVTLGRKRGVVVEAGRGGHYRVQVENAVVLCREHDLAAPTNDRGKTGKRPKRPDRTTTAGHGTTEAPQPPSRVDLHGLTVEDAIARIVHEIDLALRRGADRVEVVHGKGSGRIREALHRHLATMPVVREFKVDARNTGVTWVYL